jgi:3-oxoacyl-[acyl-carrier protein] reductase
MDLGIAGRRAIVCASTRGLGRACAEALLAEGVHVIINGRHAKRTATAADTLARCWPGLVNGVCADVSTAAGRTALLAACPEPDILVTNNAGPEPAAFQSLDEDAWLTAISATMVAPLMLIRAVVAGMQQRQFGRIVNITSAMVTTPRPGMALSSGARAGLTAALKGLLLEVAQHNVTINNLLPERFDTDRQLRQAESMVRTLGLTMAAARAQQVASIPARRLGKPSEFGQTCAFVCSAQAAYMTGMNIRLDGGSYPALL